MVQFAPNQMVRFVGLMTFAAVLCLMSTLTRAQDVPYTGIVIEDSSPVLAGAGKTFYNVGDLKKGALVEVHEVIFGWHKIKPPKGTFSYISKAHVNAG